MYQITIKSTSSLFGKETKKCNRETLNEALELLDKINTNTEIDLIQIKYINEVL